MSEKIVQLNEEVIKGQLKEGVSKRAVKGSRTGKKGQQFLDSENDSGPSGVRSGYRPGRKRPGPLGGSLIFWGNICFAGPV